MLIRQVAGIMARKIVCYAKESEVIKQGDEFGIIRFGSRVDFYLPLDVVVNVKLDDEVRAQETIIAQFK